MQMALERLVPLGSALSPLSWLLFGLEGGWCDVGGPLDGGKGKVALLSFVGAAVVPCPHTW